MEGFSTGVLSRTGTAPWLSGCLLCPSAAFAFASIPFGTTRLNIVRYIHIVLVSYVIANNAIFRKPDPFSYSTSLPQPDPDTPATCNYVILLFTVDSAVGVRLVANLSFHVTSFGDHSTHSA